MQHDDMLAHKFNVHTTVHIHDKSACTSAETRAKHAITMVFADCVHNTVIVCIGSSLHICDPPDSTARLLAGCQNENGFRDGQRDEARLSTIHGVAVASDGTILLTDWMNNCVRELATSGYLRTLYGPGPSELREKGFRDGYGHAALFHRPWGLCFSENESELIVVDGDNSSLRRIHRATAYVSTMQLQQDMSRTSTAPNDVVQPTQLLYPTAITLAPDRRHVFVVNSSTNAIIKINLATLVFRPVPWVAGDARQFRPVHMDVASSGALVVAYTTCSATMRTCGTKTVSFGDLDLFCAQREVIHYKHNQKMEICSCVSVALAVRKTTHDACVWISDCRAESRLLRVRLELKWSFLRVLLLAVQKPVMGSLFSLLPTCSHNNRSVCPLLLHIVKLLQGVCVFG
jgi:DNA-binding beta-propeller fold protein YncE